MQIAAYFAPENSSKACVLCASPEFLTIQTRMDEDAEIDFATLAKGTQPPVHRLWWFMLLSP